MFSKLPLSSKTQSILSLSSKTCSWPKASSSTPLIITTATTTTTGCGAFFFLSLTGPLSLSLNFAQTQTQTQAQTQIPQTPRSDRCFALSLWTRSVSFSLSGSLYLRPMSLPFRIPFLLAPPCFLPSTTSHSFDLGLESGSSETKIGGGGRWL